MTWANRALAIAAAATAAACAGAGEQPHRAAPARPPVGAIVGPWGWIGVRGGHAVLWDRGRRWTSAGAFHRPPEWISSAAVSRSLVAFTVEGRGLFVARLPGPERRIAGAAGETVIRWASAGDLLSLDRSGHVVARSAAGTLLDRWRVRAAGVAVERSGGLLYLRPSGELARTDGARTLPLVDAGRYVADPRMVEPLADGAIAVLGIRRLAIFSTDGRLTASAGSSRRTVVQDVRAAPDGRGYAYVRTTRRAKGGIDRVELLRPGDRTAHTLATVPVSLRGCGWGSDVRWDGSWVHYRNADGRRLAVNAAA